MQIYISAVLNGAGERRKPGFKSRQEHGFEHTEVSASLLSPRKHRCFLRESRQEHGFEHTEVSASLLSPRKHRCFLRESRQEHGPRNADASRELQIFKIEVFEHA
jgi:hypothetical protein